MVTTAVLSISLLVGAVLVLFGRRMFWLASGLLGFFLGIMLITRYYTNLPVKTQWIIALIVGCLIGVALVLLQKLAISVLGFAVGAYLGYTLLQWLEMEVSLLTIGLVFALALVGLLLSLRLFDFAVSAVTSFMGAMIISDVLDLQGLPGLAMLLVIFVLGVIVQSTDHRQDPAQFAALHSKEAAPGDDRARSSAPAFVQQRFTNMKR